MHNPIPFLADMNEHEAIAYHKKKFKLHIFYIRTIEHYDAIVNIANAIGAHLIINKDIINQLIARRKEVI